MGSYEDILVLKTEKSKEITNLFSSYGFMSNFPKIKTKSKIRSINVLETEKTKLESSSKNPF
jgi:hypothetical protein